MRKLLTTKYNNMDIVITRYIGIRGTALAARFGYEELCKRYPKWLIDEAADFDQNLRYESGQLPEIGIAISEGAIYAEEYTEFGVFEALFQMSKTLKCGIRVGIKDIPVKQETVEVAEYFKANPYAMYSGYSAVIVSDSGVSLINRLYEAGIPAVIVGYTTEDNDKILINEDEESFLPHIRKDELKNILGRKEYHERTDLNHS